MLAQSTNGPAPSCSTADGLEGALGQDRVSLPSEVLMKLIAVLLRLASIKTICQALAARRNLLTRIAPLPLTEWQTKSAPAVGASRKESISFAPTAVLSPLSVYVDHSGETKPISAARLSVW
jgi:hypothetical protein